MVFSFFKKPPPEKMVARPAAAPMRPKSENVSPEAAAIPLVSSAGSVPSAVPAGEEKTEVPKDLAPLDFTSSNVAAPISSSEFSDLSETTGEIHVEGDMDPIESDIEQAAVLYANAQDEATRALLENAVHVHHFGPGERLWLMLFDFYRLSNQHAPFDALSLDYAKAFEKSPPAWRNGNVPKPAAKAAAAPAGTVLFKGELTGDNDAAFSALDQAVDKNPKLRVDLTKVKAVDDLGAERLLGVLAKVLKKKCEIELVGRDALAALLEARIETGRREESGCWLLLLELYQLMGRAQEFEDMAINYAVTFEMSPPSWEAKRVVAAEPKPALLLADEAGVVASFAPKGDLKAERFAGLPAFAEKHDPVILDFSGVTRVDFVSAGTLVNMLTPIKRQGKRAIINHPNHLVAELLGVVGLKSVAEIVLAKT